MYVVSASVPGFGMERSNIACFNPMVVLDNLKDAFPEAELDSEDYSQHMLNALRRNGSNAEAIRTAAMDAMRRGPQFRFRLSTGSGSYLVGSADRWVVQVSSDDPIPEPIRSRLLSFLATVQFASFVQVKIVRIHGNEELPV